MTPQLTWKVYLKDLRLQVETSCPGMRDTLPYASIPRIEYPNTIQSHAALTPLIYIIQGIRNIAGTCIYTCRHRSITPHYPTSSQDSLLKLDKKSNMHSATLSPNTLDAAQMPQKTLSASIACAN
jgi:hypothetical protein